MLIASSAAQIELPVQLPVKFEMAVNIKTAKAIAIAIPESFLLRADEVIE
jgi:putative ABC transport system substrate-binding protein